MAHKQAAQPELPAEDQELVRRVDDMMGSEPADGAKKVTAKDQKAASGSAPVLPAALLKKIKVSEPESQERVLKIDHVDPQPEPAKAEPDTDVEEPKVEEPEPKPAPEEEFPMIEDPEAASIKLEDETTDSAVDDIVANEGDTLLALEDDKNGHRKAKVTSGGPGHKGKLKAFFTKKPVLIGIAVILLIIFALPMTRYTILGLVVKKSVTISVVDSKTATPVSSAQVELGSGSAKTNADGQATVKVGLGQHNLVISKHYYSTSTTKYLVGLKSGPSAKVKLTATGRLVPVTVTNTVSGKPLAGVVIVVHGTTAKTNAKGIANIALPTSSTTDSATMALKGYNSTKVAITVTDEAVKSNSFTLTPAGQVYFLSNATGKIEVVKSNLDGTDRKTILEGTGKEDANNTSLLASRDWRFLVLKSRRDSTQPALYLIDTSTDRVSEFDNSSNTKTLIGWSGHSFMYDLNNDAAPGTQAGREVIKSYDADHLQLNQLDANLAEGTGASFAYQSFSGFYVVGNQLVYSTQWFTSYSPSAPFDLTGKTATIRQIQPNGQNKKDVQTFPASTTGTIQASLYEPQAIYFAVYDNGSSKTTFYEYENQAVKPASIDQSTFSQAYPTYLLSPGGSQTFWTELRDGKNTLFTGDVNAASKKTIATASDYSPYGWFSDNYVLVSKNSSELFIMPAGGTITGHQPFKISNYYKPAQNFQGYGGGYGGL